jgi:hypothetical protein
VTEFASEEERLLCHLYLVLGEDVPSCGCGWPQDARRLVWDLLSLMPTYGGEKKRRLRKLIGPEGSQQIVLCALERAGLITHGLSVDSAALAPRGRWVLWAVERVGGLEGLEAGWETAGFPHADGECEEACWVVPDDWMPVRQRPGPPESGQRANFVGLGPLLESEGPWETAQYVGPGSITDPVDPGGLVDLIARISVWRPLACPGRSCLLHGTEHQRTGRQ